MWDSLVRPAAERAAVWRANGWWRAETFTDDLAKWAAGQPDRPAVIGYGGGELERALTYGELATAVDRAAAALRDLGVGPRDTVVVYVPNRWVLPVLYLACVRIGAVVSPAIPAHGARELAYILETSGAKVCVTVDRWNGIDYDERLVAASESVPVTRVVIGDAARTGAIDFYDVFDREVAGRLDGVTACGPDDPALLLFTSGTTGKMKGVVHTPNTLYAAVRAVSDPLALGPDDVLTVPNFLTHMAGSTYGIWMSLLVGGAVLTQDDNTDMRLLLRLIDAHRVSFVYAAPGYVFNLVRARREAPAGQHRDLPALKHIVTGSAPIDPQLIDAVRDAYGVRLLSLWGMTENGAVTMSRPDDPADWAAHSDGRAEPWMDVRVEVEPGQLSGPLYVRGASQCLGYYGQRDVYEAALDADGWFDTGDLARDDGRGGIRITGRTVDLIIRASGQKVSTLEVEAILNRHPHVAEAVLIGYPDPSAPGTELVCAVVIPDGDTPTLEELHAFLEQEGMSKLLWPDRLQFVRVLPKNSLGKVLRPPLRQRLEMAAAPRG
jgi:cyclohexanecarboxylate-CoA ligase